MYLTYAYTCFFARLGHIKLIVRLTDFFVKKFFVRLKKKIKIKSGFQTLTVNVFLVKSEVFHNINLTQKIQLRTVAAILVNRV